MVNFSFLTSASLINEIKLNSNILETNLLNIAILGVIIFFVGKDFLSSNLTNRYETILVDIKNAEDKLNEAAQRLIDTEAEVTQINLTYQNLLERACGEACNFVDENHNLSKQKIDRDFSSSLQLLKIKQLELLKLVVQTCFKKITETYLLKQLKKLKKEDLQLLNAKRIYLLEAFLKKN